MDSVLRFGLALAVVAGTGMVVACGGGDGGGGGMTDPPTQTSAIRATVTRDGSPASGVTVRLFAGGGTSAQATLTTGGDGAATFQSLAPGAYEVEVEVPSGNTLSGGAPRRPVTAQAGATAAVTFALMSSVSGDVREVIAGANLLFNPASVTIQRGTTVQWRNEAAVVHTITPQGHSEWSEGTVTAAGDVFSHTFQSTGTFPYSCVLHAGMTGTVTVQ
jgi:plastocyanin